GSREGLGWRCCPFSEAGNGRPSSSIASTRCRPRSPSARAWPARGGACASAAPSPSRSSPWRPGVRAPATGIRADRPASMAPVPADAAGEAETAVQKADYAKALKLARPLAEDGDARAETVLGSAYYRGRGVPQNDSEAAKWFRLAADQGNAVARFTLGVMYGEGRGVPQDYAEAARRHRRAAEQADVKAHYNPGPASARGEGVTQNVVDAHMWFNLSAARFPANDTRNRTAAVKNRDTVAGEMSSDQFAEAQKRAREWKPQS